jgi:hypothetical protein
MSQPGDIIVRKGRDAVFIDGVLVHLPGMLVSPLGVLKRLPGELLPGLVILFLMSFRSATMRMGSAIVQLGSSLMTLVMRSVIITGGHYRLAISPDFVWASFASL